MIHRLAIVIGGVGALAVLAVALMLNGLSIVGPALADSSDAATPLASASPTAPASDTVVETVVDTVYIEAPASPEASFEAPGDDDDDYAGSVRDVDDDHGRSDDSDDHGQDDDDDDHGPSGDSDDHGSDDDDDDHGQDDD